MGCFGCLKKIIILAVLAFAAIGFVQTGAWDFCKEKYNEYQEGKTGKVPKETRSPFEQPKSFTTKESTL